MARVMDSPPSLPPEAAELWQSEFDIAYDARCLGGNSRDRLSCAASRAWKGVKKEWRKEGHEWVSRKPRGPIPTGVITMAQYRYSTGNSIEAYRAGVDRGNKSRHEKGVIRLVKKLARRGRAFAQVEKSMGHLLTAMEISIVERFGSAGLKKYQAARLRKRNRDSGEKMASLVQRAIDKPTRPDGIHKAPTSEPHVNPTSLLIENEDYQAVVNLLEPMWQISIENAIQSQHDPDQIILEAGGLAATAKPLKRQGTAMQALVEAKDLAVSRLESTGRAVNPQELERAAKMLLAYLSTTHFSEPVPAEAAIVRESLSRFPYKKRVVTRSVQVNPHPHIPSRFHWLPGSNPKRRSTIRDAARRSTGLPVNASKPIPDIMQDGPSLVERSRDALILDTNAARHYDPSQMQPVYQGSQYGNLLNILPPLQYGQAVRHTVRDVRISQPNSARPDGLIFATAEAERRFDQSGEQPPGTPFHANTPNRTLVARTGEGNQ